MENSRLSVMRLPLLVLLALLSPTCAGQTDPVDQSALIALWNGLTSKGSLSWNTEASLCGQTGVYCEDTKVTEIYMRKTEGTISTEIGLLTSLRWVNLIGSSLSGTLPTEIGTMTSLYWVDLNDNSLNGTIPTEIGMLNQMCHLNLRNNSLTGTIPSEIGFSLIWDELDLSGNSLSGTIPTELGKPFSMRTVNLSGNRLSGSIPTELALMGSLEYLDLQDNHLSGTIPTELGASKEFQRRKYRVRLGGTNHFCPLVDYSGWATITDFPMNNATCEPCAAPFVLCPEGFSCQGGTNETFTCQAPGCPPQSRHRYASWPQTAPGAIASGTCMQGYQGTPTRLCRADRTWETAVQNECTRSVCPTVEEGGFTWPSRQSGNIVNFLCPTGFSGRPTRTCLDPGVWSPIENPCTEKGCPAVASYKNAAWPQTSRGQVATGTCAQGYSGTITRNCKVEGYWSPTVQGSCARDKCAADMSENATWPSTTAGEAATGTCDAGFSGAPTRACQADATWAAAQNPCTRNQCPASSADEGAFEQSDSLTTVTGACTLPLKGTPTRECRVDGTWGAISMPCSVECPASVYGRATWPTTLGSRYASGTCDEGYASSKGVPKRFCNQDGTWSTSIVYVCLNKKCPVATEDGVTWPETSTFSTAAVSCPSGRTLKARRLCRSDATWDVVQNPC